MQLSKCNSFQVLREMHFQGCKTFKCCKCIQTIHMQSPGRATARVLHVFFNKGILKNYAIFTGKHLCWSLFLMKLQACNFIKKRLQQRYFPVNFAKFLRTHFLENTSVGCFCQSMNRKSE